MELGLCALCLKDKELVKSHCISAGIYRRLGADLIVMTPEVHVSTSKQVRDHLLCQKCEGMIGEAEDFVIPLLWEAERKSFPFLSMLRAVKPSGVGRVSAAQAGIDVNKLAYFAVSFFWRASVKVWPNLNRQTISMPMGNHEEPARKFLHNESDFPPGFVLKVVVCTDFTSHGLFFAPAQSWEGEFEGYEMFVLGLYFTLLAEVQPGHVNEKLCCVKTKEVFLEDCSETSGRNWRVLRKDARIASNVTRRP